VRAVTDRRRELLVNAYEELTLELLGGAAAPWGCRAAYKVRVADALTIDGSDLDAGEREYALMAHFDFVVVQVTGAACCSPSSSTGAWTPPRKSRRSNVAKPKPTTC